MDWGKQLHRKLSRSRFAWYGNMYVKRVFESSKTRLFIGERRISFVVLCVSSVYERFPSSVPAGREVKEKRLSYKFS